MPAEAFWTVAELRTAVGALGQDSGVLFVVLSYRWLTKVRCGESEPGSSEPWCDPLMVPMQEHPDPDAFHLSIVAKVAEMYLSAEKDDFDGFASPLAEQFEAKGLGTPDFAFFQDYPWCARGSHAVPLAATPALPTCWQC